MKIFFITLWSNFNENSLFPILGFVTLLIFRPYWIERHQPLKKNKQTKLARRFIVAL